jgi:DNA-binding protein H-NS
MKELEAMSIPELRQLQERIDVMIVQKQDEARQTALAKVREVAEAAGFALEDLVRTSGGHIKQNRTKAGDRRSAVAAKYRDPNTGATWSGRGKKPRWVEAHITAGGTLDSLAI